MQYNVYQDSLLSTSVEVNGQRFEIDRDFAPNIANNISATMRFNEVVYLGTGVSVDSVRNMNLAGKLVMVAATPPTPGRPQPGGGGIMGALQSKGIGGLLIVQTNFPRTTPSNRKGNESIHTFRRSILPQQFAISESIAKAIT